MHSRKFPVYIAIFSIILLYLALGGINIWTGMASLAIGYLTVTLLRPKSSS